MSSRIQGHQDVGFTVFGYTGGPIKEEGLAFPFKMGISGLRGRSIKGTKAGKEE